MGLQIFSSLDGHVHFGLGLQFWTLGGIGHYTLTKSYILDSSGRGTSVDSFLKFQKKSCTGKESMFYVNRCSVVTSSNLFA